MVGPGPKQPLTTEEVQRVLTSDQAKFLASCTGPPLAPLLPLIAIEKMAHNQGMPEQAVHEAIEQADGEEHQAVPSSANEAGQAAAENAPAQPLPNLSAVRSTTE